MWWFRDVGVGLIVVAGGSCCLEWFCYGRGREGVAGKPVAMVCVFLARRDVLSCPSKRAWRIDDASMAQ